MPIIQSGRDNQFYPSPVSGIYRLTLFGLAALAVVMFSFTTVLAQSGPGGVGNNTDNKLWLRADSIVGIAGGNPITTWEDASGNGNDVTQATASYRPTFSTNILNGFPVVSFDPGNTEFLAGSLGGTLNAPYTIFSVLRFDNTTAYSYALNIGNGGANANISISRDHEAIYNTYYCWTGSGYYETPQDSLPAGAIKILSLFHNTSSPYHTIFSNGLSHTITPAGATSINAADYLSVGRRLSGASGTNYMDGYIAEMIIYDKQLNTAERIIVENYLTMLI